MKIPQLRFSSRDLLVYGLGLILSIAAVWLLYEEYIWPTAEQIKVEADVFEQQNPDEVYERKRSIAVLLKNEEQFACLVLMLWAMVIIVDKFVRLSSERSMAREEFLNIERGERIIPEEALGHYKDVESRMRRRPRLSGKILTDVILAALHRFDATRSIQDAAHAVRDRSEMAYQRLESELSLIRYIAWAIPSVGFIGTVRGISLALSEVNKAVEAGELDGITSSLGLAFNSTFIALLLSIGLMLIVHMLQSKQDSLLIDLEEHANKSVVSLMKTPTSTQQEEPQISYS